MKNLLIVGIVVVVAIAGLWFWKSSRTVPGGAAPAVMEQTGGPESVTDAAQDWLAAIASGRPMQCTYEYQSSDGGVMQATVFIEGKKYRMETNVAGMTGTVLSDGETMYTWSTDTRKGTKMELSCLDSLKGEADMAPSQAEEYGKTPEDALKGKTGITCRPADQADFTVPSDVDFIDQCALLKKSSEMMKNYQDQIPQNVKDMMPAGIPGGQ